jgi:para-aminobenzoate synthetase component I
VRPLVNELVPAPDPVRCCEAIAGWPYRVFLDSAAQGTRLGRYSFLSADPVVVVRSKTARSKSAPSEGVRTDVRHAAAPQWTVFDGDALEAIRTLMAPHLAEPIAGLPPFQGGAAGYLAYDWGSVLERLPEPRFDDLSMPDVVFGIYDWVIAWDHESSRAWLLSTGIPETSAARRTQRARERLESVRQTIATEPPDDDTVGRVLPDPARGGSERTRPTTESSPSAPSFAIEHGWWPDGLELRSSFTHEGYRDAVARVREYIYAGDIFQANLSQRFDVALTEPAWTFYRRLRTRNRAPFAAFLDFPDGQVLSASPERFLRVDPAGHVETRPIKGTRPRGLGPEHDAALGQALTESVKDRAENLMIVDLMRNDLSRVCLPGTVRVPELFALERYATVHHLVSTVVGDLAPGAGVVELLRASFPGGSITGAPKLRAMEIIAELEPSKRGVYCGSIGYWSVTGELDTSIAIRTAVVRDGRVYFSAGGGIVADSDPELEYRETLDKARGIIDSLAAPE